MAGKERLIVYLVFTVCINMRSVSMAGPYTEAGVNGYIGDHWRHADPCDANAIVNPIFQGWAIGVVSYSPAPGVDSQWSDPNKALGPAMGDYTDIVSLGDLDVNAINDGCEPGWITLSFSETIRDRAGYDFAIFENGFISDYDTSGGSVAGEMFAELGYVEVSSDGSNFVRFPAVSLTPGPVGSYGTLEISDVFRLVGKHPNAAGVCTGTLFDLGDIADDPCVVSGVVDINNINYVRIVDIPGSGDFKDEAVKHIDPNSWPSWDNFDVNHPIYDAWMTFGSGGLDLEAVGVLREQKYSADINLDGVVDMFDFALFGSAWRNHFGSGDWISRSDLAEPRDLVIDEFDLCEFTKQWLGKESWRN
ncbi:MAG: hypothetical protein JSV82_09125 [Planctomycetota bacterium]|nr:MAG: hypothetical protein JSV82_09125 [Planctomycetota bacterium]